MLLIALFRVLMIFPFVLYFLLTLYGTSSKSAKLICSFFYILSAFFIADYVFSGIGLIVFLIIIYSLVLFLAFQSTKQKYHRLILDKVIKNFLYKFSIIYPFIYVSLMTYGFVIEYMKII
jgi:hypothetical protein